MLSFASALSQAIPTQAHLALPPLQRTNVTARPMATPLPGSNLSGIATPGSEVDASSTDRTLLKTGEASAVTRQPAQPLAQSIGQVQLDGRPGIATQIGDVSLPPIAPKSKAPLLVVGGLVLAALVGAGYALTRPEPGPAVVKTEPVAVKDPVVEPPKVDLNAEAMKLIREQEQRAREENARMSLGKGKTEFEVAKLDEAETYLKSVAADSEASVEAKALLGKIDTIREKLKVAGGLRARGQCDQALPLFKAVLDLNGRVKDALDGVADCKRSMVNTTME
jgi:tetratricopeptide (TPR) repeat protein